MTCIDTQLDFWRTSRAATETTIDNMSRMQLARGDAHWHRVYLAHCNAMIARLIAA